MLGNEGQQESVNKVYLHFELLLKAKRDYKFNGRYFSSMAYNADDILVEAYKSEYQSCSLPCPKSGENLQYLFHYRLKNKLFLY